MCNVTTTHMAIGFKLTPNPNSSTDLTVFVMDSIEYSKFETNQTDTGNE